jgi:hypothetical protein
MLAFQKNNLSKLNKSKRTEFLKSFSGRKNVIKIKTKYYSRECESADKSKYLNAGKTGFVFSTCDRQAAAASTVCRQTTKSNSPLQLYY